MFISCPTMVGCNDNPDCASSFTINTIKETILQESAGPNS